MENFAPYIFWFLVLGGSGMLTKMWSDHNRARVEIARLKFNQQASTSVSGSHEIETLRAELEATRQELRDLRDTSTQYDISFDTALGRVENRVSNVERQIRINTSETDVETATLTGR